MVRSTLCAIRATSTLSQVMGHDSIKTTFDLYGHLDVRDVTLDIALLEAT